MMASVLVIGTLPRLSEVLPGYTEEDCDEDLEIDDHTPVPVMKLTLTQFQELCMWMKQSYRYRIAND